MCRSFDFFIFFFCLFLENTLSNTLIRTLPSMTRTQRKSLASCTAKGKAPTCKMKLCRQAERENHSRCFFPSIRIKLTRLSIFSPFLVTLCLFPSPSTTAAAAAASPIQPFSFIGGDDNNEWKRMILSLFFSLLRKIFLIFLLASPFQLTPARHPYRDFAQSINGNPIRQRCFPNVRIN